MPSLCVAIHLVTASSVPFTWQRIRALRSILQVLPLPRDDLLHWSHYLLVTTVSQGAGLVLAPHFRHVVGQAISLRAAFPLWLALCCAPVQRTVPLPY